MIASFKICQKIQVLEVSSTEISLYAYKVDKIMGSIF